MRLLKEESVPFKVIGKGSNLLCSDRVYEGVVIRLDKFDDFYFLGNDLIAQSGCSIIALSYQAMKQGLSGLEFASGIPASVGGVTFMNAGAYKRSMSDVIDSVFVYRDEKFEWISNQECEFSYRHSIFHSHPDWLIIAVRIHLESAPVSEIRDLMDSRRKRRMDSQPLDKASAGSVFQNPEEMPAWQLIDGIGYRGYRIGGAMVSEKHVNFIVNEDHATAEDYLTLVNEIKRLVDEKYHIRLHMEVERFNW
jgi:UDP-N-acetylmuramate dehydrogenase